jgi:hypothetical protein
VDGDEREPVAAVHPVAGEVDPERRLRQLGGHLLRRQRHLPRLVRVPVQAQILLLWIALRVEILDVVGEGAEDGGAAGAEVLEDVLDGARGGTAAAPAAAASAAVAAVGCVHGREAARG